MGLTSVAVCEVVPVAATTVVPPVLLAGAYRYYRGAAAVYKMEGIARRTRCMIPLVLHAHTGRLVD